MNPRNLAIFFTLFILLVIAYVGWDTFQNKFELDRPQAQAYFLYGDKLVLGKKELINEKDALKESFAFLLEGPSEKHKTKGYYSAIPEALRIFGYSLEDSILILKINRGFSTYTGGTAQLRAALAQIVYTAMAQPGIHEVMLQVEGQAGPLVIGGEGYIIDKPLKRSDVRF
ncbi:GerMN domain-containing protein [Candidatus Margulisiibacteriota bacterium]